MRPERTSWAPPANPSARQPVWIEWKSSRGQPFMSLRRRKAFAVAALTTMWGCATAAPRPDIAIIEAGGVQIDRIDRVRLPQPSSSAYEIPARWSHHGRNLFVDGGRRLHHRHHPRRRPGRRNRAGDDGESAHGEAHGLREGPGRAPLPESRPSSTTTRWTSSSSTWRPASPPRPPAARERRRRLNRPPSDSFPLSRLRERVGVTAVTQSLIGPPGSSRPACGGARPDRPAAA